MSGSLGETAENERDRVIGRTQSPVYPPNTKERVPHTQNCTPVSL
jgi:hypothetical protein